MIDVSFHGPRSQSALVGSSGQIVGERGNERADRRRRFESFAEEVALHQVAAMSLAAVSLSGFSPSDTTS